MAYSSELKEIWNLALELIRPEYSESSFSLWFSEIEPVDITDKKFVLSTPSVMKKDIISKNHREKVESALTEVMGYYIEMALLTRDEAEAYRTHGYVPAPAEVVKEAPLSQLPQSTPVTDYTFENFIVGSSNKFAHFHFFRISAGNDQVNSLFCKDDCHISADATGGTCDQRFHNFIPF